MKSAVSLGGDTDWRSAYGSETFIIEDGDEIVRVHAETDVLRNVSTAAHATQSLSILNRKASLRSYSGIERKSMLSFLSLFSFSEYSLA